MSLDNDVLPRQVLRHGAYLCLRVPADERDALAAAPIPALAGRFGFRNEFDASDGHPGEAIGYLRRASASPGDLPDDDVLEAHAVVHVASASAGPVAEFCAEAARMLAHGRAKVLRGVVRPTSYTGGAMHEFAYAHQVVQQPGRDMPNAFLLPLRKTPEWWAKDWMERHTYLLPRYDEAGRMVAQGHALAAAAGIPSLMRRTYKAESEPATDGSYDFLTYFECADAQVATFRQVCAALRDTARNPEWRFVREGPTWQGRRVRTWTELFD
jgi:hypothetical protein